jgi:uncharacterized protein (TIGR02246 family)
MKPLSTTAPEWDANGNARAALESVEAQWNQAAANWNTKALAAIYTDNALFYGGRPDQYAGKDRINEYFESYADVIQSISLKFVDQHVIELGPDTFLCQGVGDFKFVLIGGKRSENTLRTTLVIKKQIGQWKVLLHHFSPKPDAPPIPT